MNTITPNLKKLLSLNLQQEWGYMCSGELLRLSRMQVPFASGRLSQSGNVKKFNNVWGTSYNTKYALFQHEGLRKDGTRVIRNWKNGRKGKYLEDPLKENMRLWDSIANKVLTDELKNKL
jgi:hypothetical protein